MFVCSLQFLTSLLKPALTEFRKNTWRPLHLKTISAFPKISSILFEVVSWYSTVFSAIRLDIKNDFYLTRWVFESSMTYLQRFKIAVPAWHYYGPRIPVCTRCITYMYGIYVRCIFVFQIFSINGALVLCWPNQQYIYPSFNRD